MENMKDKISEVMRELALKGVKKRRKKHGKKGFKKLMSDLAKKRWN